MRFPGRDPCDMPDTTQLRHKTVRSPRKPWACGICKRLRPAGMPCEEWVGTVDGKFEHWRGCIPDNALGECPVRYRTWPLWRVTFRPDPGWPRLSPEQEKAWTVEIRAPDDQAARVESRRLEGGASGFLVGPVEKLVDGTPDTDPPAP